MALAQGSSPGSLPQITAGSHWPPKGPSKTLLAAPRFPTPAHSSPDIQPPLGDVRGGAGAGH